MSLPLPPPVFPKSLNYGLQRLANLSRRKVRLTSVSGTTASPSGLITVELPAECVDFDTFAMFAKLTTTATGGAALPASADMLIADYTISVGGQVVGTSFADAYNQLKLIYDQWQQGDKATVSMMLNNCLPITATGVFDKPAANATAKPIAVTQWLGLIGSIQPRVLDLALLPKVQLTVRLAGNDVLIHGTGASAGAYSLSDIAFETDVITMPSMYYEALNAQLASGGVIECPFTNYVPFRASSSALGGANQSFSIASQSLDAIIATYIKTANLAPDRDWNAATYTSDYFSRGTSDFDGVRISVNQVPFPAYGTMDAARCAVSAIENLMGSYDTLGSCSSALSSLSAFTNGHFVVVTRLNHHDSAYGNRLICGMNTSGNPATVNVNYTGGSATAVTPFAWAQTTSLLRIGQYKQIEWVA